MKKTIVVFVLLFLLSNFSNAQIYKGFGVKVGTSIAGNISAIGDYGEPIYKYGLTAGIFRETPLFEKLSLVIGVNYTEKGNINRVNYTDEIGNTSKKDLKTYSNFINLEVLAKYGGNQEKLSPYVLAGGRMDIFTSGKITYEGNPIFLEYYPYRVTTNKTFGATVGAGLNFKPSKNLSLFVEGTYNPDFTNLGDYDNGYGFNYTVRNYNFEIKTGIKF